MATLGLGLAFGLACVPANAPGDGVPVANAAEPRRDVDGRRDTTPQRGRDAPRQPDQATQGQDTEGNEVDPITGEQVKNTSVLQYVNAIYVWLAFLGGLIAVISLMYAGYSYMASYGDPEKIANAKDIVEKTLIGLSLLILAALILNTINPRTIENPCTPGEPGCGDIDFSKPGGGVPND